jgi:hypothetical protein
MSNKQQPDIHSVLSNLGAGVFEQQLTEVLRDTAKSVMAFGDKGKNGKVTITLTMTRMGDEESDNINIDHAWEYSQPEKRGKSTRINTTSTVMTVNTKGDLTLYPYAQTELEVMGKVTELKRGEQ